MKLIDSLGTPYDFQEYGIFQLINLELGVDELTWLNDIYGDLDYIYYFNHSGQKTTTKLFNECYTSNSLDYLARIIIARYKVKWTKIYNALFDTTYNLLDDNHRTSIRTPDLSQTETQKRNVSVTTQNYGNDTDSVYGFNSTTPVNSDASSNANTQTISANGETNKTSTSVTQTGTETVTTHGSRTSAQKRIEEELELRKTEFYDILMKDVDRLLVLSVYTH